MRQKSPRVARCLSCGTTIEKNDVLYFKKLEGLREFFPG